VSCPPPHGTPPFAANRCSRQIQPTIPTETRIKSVQGSTHFFTCGLFVLIIVVSLKHQEVEFINTDASRDQNLEERERVQLPKNQINNTTSHLWKTRLLKYLLILHSHQALEKSFGKSPYNSFKTAQYCSLSSLMLCQDRRHCSWCLS